MTSERLPADLLMCLRTPACGSARQINFPIPVSNPGNLHGSRDRSWILPSFFINRFIYASPRRQSLQGFTIL